MKQLVLLISILSAAPCSAQEPPTLQIGSACGNAICLSSAKWIRYPDDGIVGTITNNSNLTFRSVTLDFRLRSRAAIVGSASAFMLQPLMPGEQFRYVAMALSRADRVDDVVVTIVSEFEGKVYRDQITLPTGRIWNPFVSLWDKRWVEKNVDRTRK